MDYSPEILRNKGIPVRFACVVRGNDDWVQEFGPDGGKEEERYLKFTHNTIADIEEEWDGLSNWQESMEDKPVSTLRKTLALIFLEPKDKIGSMLLEGRLPEYNNAIGVAWAMANGVDPEIASQLLEQAEKAVDSQIGLINDEILKATESLGEAISTTPGEKQ